jgi:hypothetical protein
MLAGMPTDCCTGGFPTATLPLTTVLVDGGNSTMPFVLPVAVFASIRLPSPEKMPIPKSSLGLA